MANPVLERPPFPKRSRAFAYVEARFGRMVLFARICG